MNLIAVRTAQPDELPWAKNSIYKFSSKNRYPTVIITIGGKLFFDKDAFEELAAQRRDSQVAKAKAARWELDE